MSVLPSIQRDLVVVRSSEVANKSFDELRLLRLRQMLNNKKLYESKVQIENSLFRHQIEFVVNCVTTDKLIRKDEVAKGERSDFGKIENRTFVSEQNVTLAREDWLKKIPVSHNRVEELVTLNVLLTQIKRYLQKEVVNLLHIFCGELHNTFLEELVKARGDVIYTGIDTNVNIISANKKLAHNMGEKTKFHVYDVIEHGLKRTFDVVLVLNADQFLNKGHLFSLLQTVSESNSTFMLSDMDLVNTSILQGIANSYGSVPSWDLGLQPNVFSLGYPVCLSKIQATQLLSLWALPLKQVTKV